MPARLEIVTGRIETLAVDAVVNAANRGLAPGAGVDGALRRAAGPALTAMTDAMTAIAEGEAVLTPGFNLPARAIIHTAAPVWYACATEQSKLDGLAACYANCIALAQTQAFASIAFPCLGTGNFAWPRELACEIALASTRAALVQAPSVTRVIFCCFTDEDALLYRAGLKVS